MLLKWSMLLNYTVVNNHLSVISCPKMFKLSFYHSLKLYTYPLCILFLYLSTEKVNSTFLSLSFLNPFCLFLFLSSPANPQCPQGLGVCPGLCARPAPAAKCVPGGHDEGVARGQLHAHRGAPGSRQPHQRHLHKLQTNLHRFEVQPNLLTIIITLILTLLTLTLLLYGGIRSGSEFKDSSARVKF